MAFKRVDDSEVTKIEGFVYKNQDGDDECVCIDDPLTVNLMYPCNLNSMSSIYYGDIPNLIKALQAAYDYHRSEKDGYK